MSAPSPTLSQARTIGQNSLSEVLTGVAVVIAITALLLFIYAGGTGGGSGYELLARVPNVSGVGIGTDVRLSGIKIGNVSDLTLDPNNFLVTIHMNIRKDIQIPTDSSLQVTSSGVLGGQFIAITPGGDAQNIPAGGRIVNAQGSVDLMGLAARFIGGDNGQPAPQQQNPSQKPAQSPPAQTPPPSP